MTIRKIKTLVNFINIKFPPKSGEKWDHNGFIFGSLQNQLNGIVVALDLTKDVLNLAINSNASIIITHHPFFFEEKIKDDFNKHPYKQKIFTKLKKHRNLLLFFAYIFDVNANGMSKAVTELMDIKNNEYTHIEKYGILIKSKKISNIFDFFNLFNKKIDINSFKLSSDDFRNWQTDIIGLLPGSGSIEDILSLSKKGAQFIVTSDIKWSDWLTIRESNINVIEVPHSIENAFVPYLIKILKAKFKNIPIHSFENKLNLKNI